MFGMFKLDQNIEHMVKILFMSFFSETVQYHMIDAITVEVNFLYIKY